MCWFWLCNITIGVWGWNINFAAKTIYGDEHCIEDLLEMLLVGFMS
jgi:hypothetical protein